ncbi:MAG TPA: bifunctional phosphopantothenoylcysteine decarboxylase/phosphopantothenate--cysteine ligase CoaBC [Phototrophicaceae bacterium]|jgi:phosphopantothenoylcysteine decarboxylase/phosphopantothenate--cysteine ligase|nr:bifunctional phosphopantothenoylcysteine decarboxylase/phosphopantothenate--cysteine ligase CoaBC [Phototrophicaceae bacterium]
MSQDIVTLLQGKHILLGVTGSIAVYKALDLASKLTQAGALVDVIMTEAAQRFVTPLAFQALTGRPVYTKLWQTESYGGLPTHIAHIGLSEEADLLAVIPATANTIAKLAAGLTDDLLTITALAGRCPLLIAPAMDGGMYTHPATQVNIKTLIERGATLIEPEVGRFASGLVGQGRLPETPTLMGAIRRVLAQTGALAGRKIVISAGGTREAIDPVRYVTNHSSGKQGYALAQAALDAGAQVVLVSTVTSLPVPYAAELVAVNSATEMLNAVLQHSADADGLIMAAAVADFRPATIADQKIKKTSDDFSLTLNLTQNPDILLEVKAQRERTRYPRVVVGFAAESENLLTNAEAKLKRKGLEMLIANDITATDAGFGADTNRVILLDAAGKQDALPLSSKARISEIIIERVANLID